MFLPNCFYFLLLPFCKASIIDFVTLGKLDFTLPLESFSLKFKGLISDNNLPASVA